MNSTSIIFIENNSLLMSLFQETPSELMNIDACRPNEANWKKKTKLSLAHFGHDIRLIPPTVFLYSVLQPRRRVQEQNSGISAVELSHGSIGHYLMSPRPSQFVMLHYDRKSATRAIARPLIA